MAYRVQFVIDIMKQSPQNATIREEYVRCSNPACQKCNLDGYGHTSTPIGNKIRN
ncbi:MAG: hypothetical protein M3Y53_01815 [Thermoproteota archaeon]|nr:hypothetical protein [Thermoproteota archaeon]